MYIVNISTLQNHVVLLMILILIGSGIVPQILSAQSSSFAFSVSDEEAILIASDRESGERFGISASIAGNHALIGASFDDENGFRSGSAYMFELIGSTWSEQVKLVASDASANGHFGTSVSIDGDRAIVGASHGTGPTAGPGAAYVFEKVSGVWTQTAKLEASDGAGGDFFGSAVSLFGDRALIGASQDGVGEGSAYVFRYTGSDWLQEQKLVPDDSAVNQQFGSSVALADDRAVVGAKNDSSVNSEQGAVYVFVRNNQTWTQEVELSPSDGASGDDFGNSVSISDNRIIVGAPRHDATGANSGAAYMFVLSGTTWSAEAKLTADDGQAEDQFGYAVTLSDGRAVVGSVLDDDAGSASGSAYVFVRDGSEWMQDEKLTASDAGSNSNFGSAVSIDSDRAIVGASGIASSSDAGGAAYVFSGVTTVAAEPSPQVRPVSIEIAPNPANSTTTVWITTDEAIRTLSIATYDLLGREVLKIYNENLPFGKHGLNIDTSQLASGLYLVRMETSTQFITHKFSVIH